jgi:acid stress-induced BolA-like protein IbaG/YrbA
MSPADVKNLLLMELKGCEVTVESNGSHFDIGVTGEVFSGLGPVQRQQLVYAVLRAHISDGSIHAVNMKTFTPEEMQSQ